MWGNDLEPPHELLWNRWLKYYHISTFNTINIMNKVWNVSAREKTGLKIQSLKGFAYTTITVLLSSVRTGNTPLPSDHHLLVSSPMCSTLIAHTQSNRYQRGPDCLPFQPRFRYTDLSGKNTRWMPHGKAQFTHEINVAISIVATELMPKYTNLKSNPPQHLNTILLALTITHFEKKNFKWVVWCIYIPVICIEFPKPLNVLYLFCRANIYYALRVQLCVNERTIIKQLF